jgi:hypothetical protein
VNVAEQLIEEGFQKGLAQGRAEERAEGGRFGAWTALLLAGSGINVTV